MKKKSTMRLMNQLMRHSLTLGSKSQLLSDGGLAIDDLYEIEQNAPKLEKRDTNVLDYLVFEDSVPLYQILNVVISVCCILSGYLYAYLAAFRDSRFDD